MGLICMLSFVFMIIPRQINNLEDGIYKASFQILVQVMWKWTFTHSGLDQPKTCNLIFDFVLLNEHGIYPKYS